MMIFNRIVQKLKIKNFGDFFTELMPLLYSWKGKKKSNSVGKRVGLAALVSFRTRKEQSSCNFTKMLKTSIRNPSLPTLELVS
jgi:hypothetical protein